MPVSAVYSWMIPERGAFDWGAQVGRLFAQIDTTVANVAVGLSGHPTLVISAGVPSSASLVPASIFLPVGNWTTLSFAPHGAVHGEYTIARSGSYLHARVVALEHEGEPSQTPPGYAAYGFRLVTTPSSLILGGESWLQAPGRVNTTLIGAVVTSLGLGRYEFELQVSLATSTTAASGRTAHLQLWSPPLQVLMTEVRSF